MTLHELHALIVRSTILSPEDRAYWLSILTTMRPEQAQKLENILVEAEKIPLQEKVREYISLVH